MRRREFIAGIGSAAAWPLVARAQQPDRMRRIGVFMNLASDDPVTQARLAAFHQGLQERALFSGARRRGRPNPARLTFPQDRFRRSASAHRSAASGRQHVQSGYGS
jgi:hypothetical protein